MPSLSTQQLHAFAEQGYLLLRGFYDADQMAKIRHWTNELAAQPETPDKQMMYFEQSRTELGKRILSRIENFVPFHAGFESLCSRGLLTETCVQLLGGAPVALFKDKINFKLPGSDGFKAHQDAQAGWGRYAALHITSLVAIDSCTPENGCLELAGGQHRKGLLGDAWKPLDEDALDYQICPTEPGDVIFFDSFTPHRSKPNNSATARRVLYLTWNRASAGDQRAQYYIDKRKNYPPDCDREIGKDYVFQV